MASFNKVILMGNLTRDIELRFTPKGTAVGVIGLAVNRTWKDETGQQKEEVTFVDVTAFGKQAEVLGQYLKKGNPLFVEGRLRLDTWDDKQTGQKRQKIGVVLESFQFLGGSKADTAGAYQPSSAAQRAATRPPGASDRYQSPDLPKTGAGEKPLEEDDVPF